MESDNWIHFIAEEAYQNYNGRRIVLWGKYDISEKIKIRLEEQYGIKAAFYVDRDVAKIDNEQVYPTNCLQGKAKEYYVVIPVAYYHSLKEELTEGGYIKGKDYCYFCDCVVKDTPDYYEDTHGNKILGPHYGCKWVFSGFNSTVRIGENTCFSGSEFYLHNDVEIEISENCNVTGRYQLLDGAKLNIAKNCSIMGRYLLWNEAELEIGSGFTIGRKCEFDIGKGTAIIIGEDCMFSHHIYLQSHDGHSIFDVRTGENINSTAEMQKNIKIVIGNHVWIGLRSTILYNTEIGDGSIIGACSLVKGVIPNNCIAAGNPAKVIRRDIAWSRINGAEDMMDQERAYAHLTE